MIVSPGLCVKCGVEFARASRVNHLYEHITYTMSDGGKMVVGICKNCTIDPSEYQELMDAFNDYMVLQNSNWVNDTRTITTEDRRDSIADLQLQTQGNNCYICKTEITDKYIFTNGYIAHEQCDVLKVKPTPVVEREINFNNVAQ